VRALESSDGDGKSRGGDDESHGGKGVAELRSSVIRINSKNAAPAESREEENGERKKKIIWAVGWGEGKQGTI
jgi:hypothetical protein